jgi:hypothetical protein
MMGFVEPKGIDVSITRNSAMRLAHGIGRHCQETLW